MNASSSGDLLIVWNNARPAKDKFERPAGELKVVYALSALFVVAFIVFGGALGNAVTVAAKTFF